jgi:hypothetical protein
MPRRAAAGLTPRGARPRLVCGESSSAVDRNGPASRLEESPLGRSAAGDEHTREASFLLATST